MVFRGMWPVLFPAPSTPNATSLRASPILLSMPIISPPCPFLPLLPFPLPRMLIYQSSSTWWLGSMYDTWRSAWKNAWRTHGRSDSVWYGEERAQRRAKAEERESGKERRGEERVGKIADFISLIYFFSFVFLFSS